MAGTSTLTSTKVIVLPHTGKKITIKTCDLTADAADGSFANLSLEGLYGYLVKVITNPGSTAPTSNYDIELLDSEDSTADAAAGTLLNRHTSTTETTYPATSGATTPPLLCGDYTLRASGNSVNSATTKVILFIAEEL